MRLILQESVLIAVGAAAILLQIANPAVAAGVNEHSNFAARVPDRLRATMTYLYCISFGTPSEKRAIADALTRAHGGIKGTFTTAEEEDDDHNHDDDGGGCSGDAHRKGKGKVKSASYSALDPDLQLWVAATLYHTGLDIYQQVFGRIADEQLQDRIYREYAAVAIALQTPPEKWPATRALFAEYWDAEIARVTTTTTTATTTKTTATIITQQAREVARDLLYLPKSPWYLRMLTPSLRCLTAGLLPEPLCGEFGLRRSGFWYALHLAALRVLYRPLPLAVRSAPVRFCVADMRRRLQENRAVFRRACCS